jgi:hypothetical protein
MKEKKEEDEECGEGGDNER